MKKIVINSCYGGFGLSEEALQEYKNRAGITDEYFSYWHIDRDDEHLIAMIEEGGTGVNDRFSELKIVEIPDDVEWQVEEYDGAEWVAERHRVWS